MANDTSDNVRLRPPGRGDNGPVRWPADDAAGESGPPQASMATAADADAPLEPTVSAPPPNPPSGDLPKPISKQIPFKRRVAGEWEKLIFWAVLAAFTLAMGLWLAGYGAHIYSPVPGGKAKPRVSLLGKTAFDFLQGLPSVALGADNPFAFVTKVRLPKETATSRPWRRPTRPKPPKRPNTTTGTPTKPPTPAKPTPAKPAKPPTPPKPPEVRIVAYRGVVRTAGGRNVAFITLRNPATKRTVSGFLGEGEERDGIVVRGFTEDEVEIGPAEGDGTKVRLGAQSKIVIQ